MSAFQVGHAHINGLLHFYRYPHPRYRPTELQIYRPTTDGCQGRIVGGWYEDATWIAAARLLWDENERSLVSRYGLNSHVLGEQPTPYDPERYLDPVCVAPLPVVTILKACDCYDYQACESPDYYLTEACALVNQIRHDAYRRLPAYQDAPGWEIHDPRFAARRGEVSRCTHTAGVCDRLVCDRVQP